MNKHQAEISPADFAEISQVKGPKPSPPSPGSETPVVRVGAGRRHMSQSIRGALWNRAFKHFVHEDGRPMSEREAFEELLNRLQAGEERIADSGCDRFDPKLGCLGHPAESQNDKISREAGH